MIKTTIFIFGILAISNCTLGIVSFTTDTATAAAFSCIAKAGYTDNYVSVSSSPTVI